MTFWRMSQAAKSAAAAAASSCASLFFTPCRTAPGMFYMDGILTLTLV